jgi:predicted enzyme involved in methoxymalonyl-ACP biosynthesis
MVILKKENEKTLFIDTWIMSCRVLKRGMERFTLQAILDLAHKNGYSLVTGEYLPTAKNGMVQNHFADLGFKEQKGKWILEVDENTVVNPSFISRK